MRAVLQRALAGRVVLQQSNEVTGKIDKGLVILLGISTFVSFFLSFSWLYLFLV